MLWVVLAGASALLWLLLLVLPWAPWRIRETLQADPHATGGDLDDITVLIPARNEARHIHATLAALAVQDPLIQVIVVDDQSDDGTADAARQANLANLKIIVGRALPSDWSGKLWALEQGLSQVDSKYVLLLDADIQLQPGMLQALVNKMRQDGLRFVSLMVELRMQGFWERLLLPAFVYFFKLVYPFHLSNDPRLPRFAAAAGGCILVEAQALRDIHAFGSLRDALIDDCTLAQRIKAAGNRTWIGLTRDAHSLRHYDRLADIWNMVARTAFTQLHYSSVLLVLVSLLMALAYWIPWLALFAEDNRTRLLALIGVLLMVLSYLPTLRYYGRSLLWAVLMPVTGSLFLGMTWSSAWRYLRGRRSAWKGRVYHRNPAKSRTMPTSSEDT